MSNRGRTLVPQRLNVLQLHAQGLFAEKDKNIKGLILVAGGDILFGNAGQKAFQFLFTR